MNSRLEQFRLLMRYVLAAAYLFVGVVHLRSPDAFLPIVPDWVPLPRTTVLFTGICEIAGAVALLTYIKVALRCGGDARALRNLRFPRQHQTCDGRRSDWRDAAGLVVSWAAVGISARNSVVGAVLWGRHLLALPSAI
jgi:hypothetical protein